MKYNAIGEKVTSKKYYLIWNNGDVNIFSSKKKIKKVLQKQFEQGHINMIDIIIEGKEMDYDIRSLEQLSLFEKK